MPELGERRKGQEVGRKGKGWTYSWTACLDCGKERWVALLHHQPIALRCVSCGVRHAHKGKRSANWKGGIVKKGRGYVGLLLTKDDPLFVMAGKAGYVMEHRLVMARHLGRPLTKQETIHHINGVKDDNRLENLDLMPSNARHNRFATCAQCTLRKEVRLLRWELKQLREALQEKMRL